MGWDTPDAIIQETKNMYTKRKKYINIYKLYKQYNVSLQRNCRSKNCYHKSAALFYAGNSAMDN